MSNVSIFCHHNWKILHIFSMEHWSGKVYSKYHKRVSETITSSLIKWFWRNIMGWKTENCSLKWWECFFHLRVHMVLKWKDDRKRRCLESTLSNGLNHFLKKDIWHCTMIIKPQNTIWINHEPHAAVMNADNEIFLMPLQIECQFLHSVYTDIESSCLWELCSFTDPLLT